MESGQRLTCLGHWYFTDSLISSGGYRLLIWLITGDGKLILMTSTFDILFEAPLNTEEFGEGRHKPGDTWLNKY